MPGALAGAGKTDKRIEPPRFVYSFASKIPFRVLRSLLLGLMLLVLKADCAGAAGPPPDRPIPNVTAPYWTAELIAPGDSLAVSDLNGDGYLEIIAATQDGRLAAWNAFGNSIDRPAAMPALAPKPSGKLAFATAVANIPTLKGGALFTATVVAREGDQEIARLDRRMYGAPAHGFDLWPGADESSALVGDDEGLVLWRIGGQSLRFATHGRPISAWTGRLAPNGPTVVVALVDKQVQVWGASSAAMREGLLWRAPRPPNETQTPLEEDNAQQLDRTGRKWWGFGSGDTIHLIRDDGQLVAVPAPGPVTHIRLGDLDGDGAGEIVVSLDDGRVAAMTTGARVLWQLSAGPQIKRLDVIDPDGNGRDLVLALDESPALRLYDGNGQEITRLDLPFPPIRHIVTDLNNDGKPEILVATSSEESEDSQGAIVVTDARGKKLWQREQGPADWLALLRSGGKVRALVSDNGDQGLAAYSPEGAPLWRYTAIGAVYYDVADLRGDGVDGILLSSKVNGPMLALDSQGREMWKFDPAPKVWMNTNWVVTATHGARGLYESWYTLGAGDNPDQSFVSRLDPATGKEVWRLRVPQTVYITQGADTDGDGEPEIWAFTWPGSYRLDAETGAYLQVSEAKWSNSGWFRVTNLDSSKLDQVAFFDPNGAELHGLVAEQPPWAGVMRAEAGLAGVTSIVLSNLFAPGKSSTLSVTLTISAPVANRWFEAGPAAREEKSNRLTWTTTAFGPWDAGQKRAYELRIADNVYTLTLTGTLAIPPYASPSVQPIEGGRYRYRLPLNAARPVTATLLVLRPGSQEWEKHATEIVPPGLSGQWDVAPFGVWDSGQTAQAHFVLDDGIRADIFAQTSGPAVEAQPAPQVKGTALGYQFSGQIRDPRAVTLTIEMLDPAAGWSLARSDRWGETAQAVVPAGGGAFAVQVRSFYDAFDVGRAARYRIWADDGTRRAIWIESELSPISGVPWWAYLVGLALIAGAGSSGALALWQQRRARRLAQEMHVARAIQESLMPETVPTVPGLDIAGGSTPALEVGGDFFGYYRRENGDLGVAVGDVSGKGLPAALLMAVSVGILAAEVNRTEEPSIVLDHINTALEYYTRRNRLNTAVCYVMLSRQERQDGQVLFNVSAANAGGIAPFLRRADGGTAWLDVSGLPLGIPNTEDKLYQPMRVEIQRGDWLVLTSDGVIEAMNAARELFGFERFERAVAENTAGDAANFRAQILSKMHAFAGGVPPHDDVTLVVIRVV